MRWVLAWIFLIAVGVAAFAVLFAYYSFELAGGPADKPVVVLIAPRTGVSGIAAKLRDANVVSSAVVLALNIRLRGEGGKLKAGEYEFPAHVTMADAAEIMIEGRSLQHKLTAAEGLTSEMIYALVKADPVLTGDPGPVPAEGTLLPETYLYTRGTTRAELLERMRVAQEKYLAAHWATRTPGLPYRSKTEAIVLASLVEKETGVPSERARVAGVFVNRLNLGMKLQSDPTIIYGLTRGYPLGRRIRESEILAATPYNTYVIAGLPSAPICNPGKDAIAAVLDPQTTKDLYFVANGTGGHVFAETQEDQNRNVAAWHKIHNVQK
ncbi:MAG TPA: endolytic transglycosylase MltG [Rhizomicrobium sp.]|jgi:UPF0755 protein